ncbi:hypothetical protein [Endozoicomonas acroporae]|uniref:hypothetical protein n=1 Tax=Endozoicomonas acroporae TaxID=1701104 RepID=UPI0013D2D4FB|nr:hypothetical protein [Endozoicomonas acroporae]
MGNAMIASRTSCILWDLRTFTNAQLMVAMGTGKHYNSTLITQIARTEIALFNYRIIRLRDYRIGGYHYAPPRVV